MGGHQGIGRAWRAGSPAVPLREVRGLVTGRPYPLGLAVGAAVAAGLGKGLLAAGTYSRGSTALLFGSTLAALALAWTAVGHVRREQAEAALEAAEQERRRLARELHTTLGHLAFISAQTTVLQRRSPEPNEALQDIAEAADEAARRARQALTAPAGEPDR
jgi:signal transduction histidine kinase